MSYKDTRKYITNPLSGERVLEEEALFYDPETTNCPLWPYSRPDKKSEQPDEENV
ncbi:hypothetical protein [Methylobacter marinus]|uniref:hypothetical protein n=1 Tax=Methylobacter marinus TaxID=34058 RepID=UPI0003779E73|nr:hypothetical protein [Methylobacter marinus]